MTDINGYGVIARRPIELEAVEVVAAKKADEFRRPDMVSAMADKQILSTPELRTPTAAEFAQAINTYQPTEADLVDMEAAPALLNDEVRNDLVFDPGAWEKHANVLVAAIIALNIARVANAQLRGHFGIMAADAAKAQGAAIIESGKASLHSAITAAAVSGAIAGFAMVKTFQGQGLKHADISQNRRNVVDANNIERDLKADLGRDDWDPQTTYPIKTFDDFGRITTVDFKPKGTSLTPDEQKWFEGEILKAQKVGQNSDWLSQMGGKSIEKKLELGRAFNAMSMSMSQVVSNIVRMTEHAAREKEVLQQSAQTTQKSLSDEYGQKDSADAALLQKIMEMVLQLFQSRAALIREV
ncbi:cell invasion protein [Pseudomonas sp. REP124]|uniref:IpaC/SipC family type III secretion system effector n=1 Tax=Pseudomonas sp. REP124 TaxID=2875731 RepID=UPI001CCB565A|nr:IpaC/SipC family type III secretion system effector [Pseudomonas sp. REP124]MBZ9781927.1 cell invasion protein [Pseudomonas sp. REP124]